MPIATCTSFRRGVFPCSSRRACLLQVRGGGACWLRSCDSITADTAGCCVYLAPIPCSVMRWLRAGRAMLDSLLVGEQVSDESEVHGAELASPAETAREPGQRCRKSRPTTSSPPSRLCTSPRSLYSSACLRAATPSQRACRGRWSDGLDTQRKSCRLEPSSRTVLQGRPAMAEIERSTSGSYSIYDEPGRWEPDYLRQQANAPLIPLCCSAKRGLYNH